MTFADYKHILEVKKKNAEFAAVRAMLGELIDLAEEVEMPENAPKKVKRPKQFKPKECECCGQIFVPNSGAQKICNSCRDDDYGISDFARELAEV